ncbi:MAG: helix-turn-helix transcriptional regulator [Saprospiraceae bacterium]|nr:helix-turn-helix transcriptional regulator [Saprospiraceae bacterium]
MRKTNTTLNGEKLHVSSEMLRAMAHPLRLRIIEFIDKNGSINVNKIYNSLRLEQSITSQHLRVLRAAGVVKTTREGKFIHYSLDYEIIGQALQAIRSFLKNPA